MKYLMIGLVRLYQKIISPIKPSCCRFTPTCSAYAIEAFKKRGFFVGLFLTVRRILRCNPFCKGGYDPVPDKGFRRPKNAESIGDNGTEVGDVSGDEAPTASPQNEAAPATNAERANTQTVGTIPAETQTQITKEKKNENEEDN